ncbi:arginine/serine-rich protein 1 isoform X2 [Meriones unguiculatus]|uniref:arginine/serine-rich protein 1 isoform X2 n=1 Tax=Meriones unguiculatus TaxID=10047 RepID=UPI00293E02D9|nr:arginine/serine-rich protein 1 isoform X2 [Meriones unguiculatus]
MRVSKAAPISRCDWTRRDPAPPRCWMCACSALASSIFDADVAFGAQFASGLRRGGLSRRCPVRGAWKPATFGPGSEGRVPARPVPLAFASAPPGRDAVGACGRSPVPREEAMSSAAVSKYVNDMWPGSPQEKASPSASGSGRSSRLWSRSRSRSSSRSSGPASRSSSRSSSRSRSRPRRSRRSRSRSRSRSRRRHQRKYRRYSRSYSRSRSRSRGRRSYRDGYYGRARRHYQSPSPYRSRSRSRSRGRSHHRRSYYAITRGRRYYGFGRTVYPEDRPRWRERSRTRSRSRSGTPFRLSEKDRMELLEIAKANAAKALGTANFDLPASLRSVVKETAVSRGGAKMEKS